MGKNLNHINWEEATSLSAPSKTATLGRAAALTAALAGCADLKYDPQTPPQPPPSIVAPEMPKVMEQHPGTQKISMHEANNLIDRTDKMLRSAGELYVYMNQQESRAMDSCSNQPKIRECATRNLVIAQSIKSHEEGIGICLQSSSEVCDNIIAELRAALSISNSARCKELVQDCIKEFEAKEKGTIKM